MYFDSVNRINVSKRFLLRYTYAGEAISMYFNSIKALESQTRGANFKRTVNDFKLDKEYVY